MDRIRNYVLGMLLSLTTWEAWQNVIISLVVAFLGGFAAASGRHIHKRFLEWKERRAESREEVERKREAGAESRGQRAESREEGAWRRETGEGRSEEQRAGRKEDE